MNRQVVFSILFVATYAAGAGLTFAAESQVFPLAGTEALDWPEDEFDGRMMDGAHQFVERKIADAARDRGKYWRYDTSSAEAYSAGLQENRDRLREIIGAVDPRLPPRMERFGDDTCPCLVAETSAYRVYQVRWPVLAGVDGEGLLVQPVRETIARVVAVPDADQSPEELLGLAPGLPPERQWARRLAENGLELVIPVLVRRQLLETDDQRLARTEQTYREWIYRQAFHMGRHIVGYEVQKILAAVDWFEARYGPDAPIGVAGYAEGGLLAMYAAALDTRIHAALVSGYFDARQRVWSEPIYRNVWSLLRRFGDAEIASLILPRQLVIEHSPVPTITGHKGDWQTPTFESVQAEFQRIPLGPTTIKPSLITGPDGAPLGPGSIEALGDFVTRLCGERPLELTAEMPSEQRRGFDPDQRHRRTASQLEQHVQGLVRASEHVRDRFFLYSALPELAKQGWTTEASRPVHSPDKFIAAARDFRQRFAQDGMGQFDENYLPARPRTRKIIETDQWTAYDVVLDVWPELFAWGVLVVPNDIREGERRPVVVCQHGRNGLPRNLVDRDTTAYRRVAAQLAERGFVTFAPHNLYRGEDRYRWLDRKANTIQATLFSFIIAQHDQILRWLDTLPFVDGSRIGFYGLSYGGETAVRVPSVLEKYALSICSGDFNQWTRKVAATDQPFSFMRTIEWEMPYWNLGHTFDYAEMAYLIFPRPFMVERGHLDTVGRDQWVAHEYAQVRWLYTQLGLPDRTEIEYFQGGHSMRGVGTFQFLHRHLEWPEKQ